MYGKDVSESMIALIFQVKLVKVCSQGSGLLPGALQFSLVSM